MFNKYLSILVCLISGFSYCQNTIGFFQDESNKILTARALGLGGAYTSIADDASALHWNPASLAFLTGPSVVVSGGLQKNFGSLKETESPNYTTGLITSTTYDESPLNLNFNQIAVAVPIVINEYRGVRITPSFGYSFSSNFTHLKEHWLIEDNLYGSGFDTDFNTNYDFDISGGRKDLSFGFGISINEFVSFGITQHNYRGERTSKILHVEDQDGNVYYNSISTKTETFRGEKTTFAVKYTSYGEIDTDSDEYEEGVDLSLAIDLPSSLIKDVVFNENGISGTYSLYGNTSSRYKFGFSGRTSSSLFCMDFIFEPTKLNTYTFQDGTNPILSDQLTRSNSDTTNVLSFGAGYESEKYFRLGMRAKQYQYHRIDDMEKVQPWTFQLNGGLTFSDMNHRFNLDFGASLEFYNWGTVYSSNLSTIDYKGALFNLLASFRMVIPYK